MTTGRLHSYNHMWPAIQFSFTYEKITDYLGIFVWSRSNCKWQKPCGGGISVGYIMECPCVHTAGLVTGKASVQSSFGFLFPTLSLILYFFFWCSDICSNTRKVICFLNFFYNDKRKLFKWWFREQIIGLTVNLSSDVLRQE